MENVANCCVAVTEVVRKLIGQCFVLVDVVRLSQSSFVCGVSGMLRIEDVFPSAFGTDRLHATLAMPVTVPRFDVDPTPVVVRRQEHRWLLARADPPPDQRVRASGLKMCIPCN